MTFTEALQWAINAAQSQGLTDVAAALQEGVAKLDAIESNLNAACDATLSPDDGDDEPLEEERGDTWREPGDSDEPRSTDHEQS